MEDVHLGGARGGLIPDRSLRGDPRIQAGRRIELYSNASDGIHLMGFRRGDAVLIRTSRLDGDGPSTWNSVVWRFTGGQLQLYVMRDEAGVEVWTNSDRRIEDVRWVREALALVAPTVVGLPPTDTERRADSGWFVGAVGVVVSLALLWRWPFSRSRLARGPTGRPPGSR